MKKNSLYLWIMLVIGGSFSVTAQSSERQLNAKMDLLCKPGSNPDWIDFRDEVEVSPVSVFFDYATYFGLGSVDNMRLVRSDNDELGYTHYRYQQYSSGYKVKGGEFTVHVNGAGHTYSANGRMVIGLPHTKSVSVTAQQALAKAMAAMGAKQWNWESDFWQAELRERTGNQDTSWMPQPELVWYNGPDISNWKPEAFRLAWTMDLYAASPSKSMRYFIDAHTYEVIASEPLESDCNTAGVTTIFNGSRTIYTSLPSPFTTYYMWNDCQTAGWRVRDWNSSTSTANPVDITSSTNSWTSNNQRFSGSINWEIQRAYAYYQAVHGRNSYDNANGFVNAYINAVFNNGVSDYLDNASMSFTGGTMKVGLGSSGTLANSWSPMDIIGHEYTHAVTGSSAALTYSYESGALNESFSDIFGEVIENYVFGSNDWLIGQERTNGAIRNMANPNAFNNPDTYQGTYWYTGTGDAGGVHLNSGVQNYWFYLLTNGGTGVNDNGQSFTVSGIGLAAARAIAYRSLTTYLSSGSQYVDARQGAIRAANDLYGSCSNEAIQTGAAWYAVGVGNSLPQFNYLITCGSTCIGGTFYGINSLSTASGCSTGADPSFSNVVLSATQYVDLKDGFTGVSNGANYVAVTINPCAYSTYRLSGPLQDVQESATTLPAKQETSRLDKDEHALSVWPNPCREQAELSFVLNDEQTVSIRLFDAKGALVNEIDPGRLLPVGVHRYHLDTQGLVAGSYQITIKIGGNSFVRQLVKND